jgi:hypothetical protein
VGRGEVDLVPSPRPDLVPEADCDDPLQAELDHYRAVLARPERPLIGDPGYLDHVFADFEAEHITEDEWKQADRAHRFVVSQRRKA